MAEIAAAVAALVAVGTKLAEVVAKLGKFLREVKADLNIMDEVQELNKELKWMHSFLEDAKVNTVTNSKLFQQWVSDVSQMADESELVVDKICSLESEEPTKHARCPSLKAMSSCCISYKKLRSTRELSGQIKKLLTDIHGISSRQSRQYPNADAGASKGDNNVDKKLMSLRRTTPYANNEYLVGLKETIDDLTNKLTNGTQFVISIFGMGGLGKTTLARKLYSTLSEQYFKSHAWICESQEYNTLDILTQLVNSMAKPSYQEQKALTTIGSMEAHLHKHLRGHRFLVVLDDVWESAAWESLERAFPDGNIGNKVIITTRNEKVALSNNAYVHKLRYLRENESWELFCRKVFPAGICTSHLRQVGGEMVAKCSGLPLAIIILGGIISKKPPSFAQWKTVRDTLWKELEKDSIYINAILSLSFNDLPDGLKPCFLYVAMFPEDFEIPRSRLMLLWEAEGFITEEDGSIEDVAKSYFNELVGRSFFKKTGGDWINSTFHVHDLLRDLAIRKASEICLYDGRKTLDISKAQSH